MERTAKESLEYFINERENVRRKKEAGHLKPWSLDRTMQETYFCNIHREDDKVTQWIREQWDYVVRVQQNDCPMIANMCMARLVNRIESLDELKWPWTEWTSFETLMFERAADKLKPFWGNAYVVTTHGQPMNKVEYACGVLQGVFERPPSIAIGATLEQAHGAIMQVEGFGSFMAAQVVADLKNTEGCHLRDAYDWHDFSAPGPGSLRGLGWLLEAKVTPSTYQRAIDTGWNMVKDDVPDMCMQDFQNCLCEFDKYMRVSTGAGRSKRRYNGV